MEKINPFSIRITTDMEEKIRAMIKEFKLHHHLSIKPVEDIPYVTVVNPYMKTKPFKAVFPFLMKMAEEIGDTVLDAQIIDQSDRRTFTLLCGCKVYTVEIEAASMRNDEGSLAMEVIVGNENDAQRLDNFIGALTQTQKTDTLGDDSKAYIARAAAGLDIDLDKAEELSDKWAALYPSERYSLNDLMDLLIASVRIVKMVQKARVENTGIGWIHQYLDEFLKDERVQSISKTLDQMEIMEESARKYFITHSPSSFLDTDAPGAESIRERILKAYPQIQHLKRLHDASNVPSFGVEIDEDVVGWESGGSTFCMKCQPTADIVNREPGCIQIRKNDPEWVMKPPVCATCNEMIQVMAIVESESIELTMGDSRIDVDEDPKDPVRGASVDLLTPTNIDLAGVQTRAAADEIATRSGRFQSEKPNLANQPRPDGVTREQISALRLGEHDVTWREPVKSVDQLPKEAEDHDARYIDKDNDPDWPQVYIYSAERKKWETVEEHLKTEEMLKEEKGKEEDEG